MNASVESNFAGRLVGRLGGNSHLTDAATGVRISGSDIPGLIVGMAAGFLSAGLRPGERVLIGCRLSPPSTLAYLGAMYAGLVPVPIEQRIFQTAGESLCSKTQARAVWTGDDIQCSWVAKAKVLQFRELSPACGSDSLGPVPRTDSDLAALMTTSGSTGVPRLVRVTHANLIANTEAIIQSQSLSTDECAMLILPISYCFGASVVHTHLYQGGAVVYDSRFMFPDKVLRAITTYGCTTFAGVPTVYAILTGRSSLRSISLPGLRRFLQAGGPLDPGTIKTMIETVPGTQFYVMYGQTEATARISCLPPDELRKKLGSVGRPLENLELRLVGENGREVSKGQTGEIWVKGPSICLGYLDDPGETDRKFAGEWLRTGDLGCFDDDGYLWIKGRKDEFMKIRGVRVSVAEVESRVTDIPGVYECAASPVPHSEAGEALALFVVPQNGVTGLQERIRQSLPPQWTCAGIHLVAALPRTANGKIARYLLKNSA